MTPRSFLVPASFILLVIIPFEARGASVHYHDFIVKETIFTRVCETKSIMTVNESFPGPVITARQGDTIYVNVHNHGDYGLTLHWHGVREPRNPWSDGPLYITQCRIEPGTNFTYEVSLTEEVGTVWWHAHSDWTRVTVHGAIIVLPAEGTTYPFPEPDGEEVIVLASWYEGNLNELAREAITTGGNIPESISYLINGYAGDFVVDCPTRQTYRWVVEYGKTYLIRLVTAVLDAEVFFAIAGHNLTIVAMDGAYIKPMVISYIATSPGRTMDILFTADQTPGLYYMATREHFTEDSGIVNFDYSNATAILEYAGNYSSNSSTPEFPDNLPGYWDYKASDIFRSEIKSLASEEHPIDVPLEITTRMFVAISMNLIFCYDTCSSGRMVVSSTNNISWLDPPVDILKAYYRNISGIYEEFPQYPPTWYNFTGNDFDQDIATRKGTKVTILNFNETVELIFQGTNVLYLSMNHPMHLHGQSFYVVGSGVGNFNNETDPPNFNLVDPPKLNTYSVPKLGWAAVRFRAHNPGVWFWHCHLDHHMSLGMNGVFIVLNGDTEETSMKPPPPGMPSCPSWNIPFDFIDSDANGDAI